MKIQWKFNENSMEIQLNLISISIQCEKEYIQNCFRLMTGNDN